MKKWILAASRDGKGEMALIAVVKAVDRALALYTADNVDAVKNEETGLIDIIYHSKNDSFPIEVGVAALGNLDAAALERELDKRSVGHCW